ncbi:MAG: FecR domain-containing protein [Ruminiclostridium sp.]|nr:FecR domain-containing protein [Ruminiclostridium sp.]
MENAVKSKRTKPVFKIIAAVIGAAVLMLSGCSENESYDSISVKEIVGDVTVENKGDVYKAYPNMKLTDGFAMTTAAASYSGMMLDTEKYARLEEQSRARFESTGSGGRSTAIYLEYGELYNEIMRPLNNGEDYIVTTPNAVLSVRSTIFIARTTKDADGKTVTDIYTFDGAVSTHRTDVDEDILVKAGYMTTIKTENGNTYYVKVSDEESEMYLSAIKIEEVDTDILAFVYAAAKIGRIVCFSIEDMEAEFARRGVDISQFTTHLSGVTFDPTPTVSGNSPAADKSDGPAGGKDNAGGDSGSSGGRESGDNSGSGGKSEDGEGARDGEAQDGDGADAEAGSDDAAQEDGADNGEQSEDNKPAENPDDNSNQNPAEPEAPAADTPQQSDNNTDNQDDKKTDDKKDEKPAADTGKETDQKQDDKSDNTTKTDDKKDEKTDDKKDNTKDDTKDDKKDDTKDDKKDEKSSGTGDEEQTKACEHKYKLGSIKFKSENGMDSVFSGKLTCEKCGEKVDVEGEVTDLKADSGSNVTYYIDFVHNGNTYSGTYTLSCTHNYKYAEDDDPLFIWGSDHKSCVARFMCLKGCGAYKEVRCQIDNTEEGIVAWCDLGDITYSETYTGDIEESGDDDDYDDSDGYLEDLG